jgi:hypothetical protein
LTGSVIPADRRGADRGNRITMDSAKRKGPGCRANHRDGLKELGAMVSRRQSVRCRLNEHRGRASPWAVPVRLRVSRIPSRLLSYCFKKPLCIERRPPFQHCIDSTSEFLGEDGQSLGFTVSADQSLMVELGR